MKMSFNVEDSKMLEYWRNKFGTRRDDLLLALKCCHIYTAIPTPESESEGWLYNYDRHDGVIRFNRDNMNKNNVLKARNGEWVFNYLQNAFLNNSFDSYDVGHEIFKHKVTMNSTWFTRIITLLKSELNESDYTDLMIYNFIEWRAILKKLIIEDLELALTILKSSEIFDLKIRGGKYYVSCLEVYAALKIAADFQLDKALVLNSLFGFDPRSMMLRLHMTAKINNYCHSCIIKRNGEVYFDFSNYKLKNNMHLLIC